MTTVTWLKHENMTICLQVKTCFVEKTSLTWSLPQHDNTNVNKPTPKCHLMVFLETHHLDLNVLSSDRYFCHFIYFSKLSFHCGIAYKLAFHWLQITSQWTRLIQIKNVTICSFAKDYEGYKHSDWCKDQTEDFPIMHCRHFSQNHHSHYSLFGITIL